MSELRELVSDIVCQLKYYDLLVVDSDVSGIVDTILNDENLNLDMRFEVNIR